TFRNPTLELRRGSHPLARFRVDCLYGKWFPVTVPPTTLVSGGNASEVHVLLPGDSSALPPWGGGAGGRRREETVEGERLPPGPPGTRPGGSPQPGRSLAEGSRQDRRNNHAGLRGDLEVRATPARQGRRHLRPGRRDRGQAPRRGPRHERPGPA